MPARTPEPTRRKVAELFVAGHTYDEISAQCGVSRSVIKRCVRDYDLPRRFKRTGFTEDRLPELEDLLADPSLTNKEIARRIACSEPMLSHYMRQYGLTRGGAGAVLAQRALPDEETLGRIRELHEDRFLSLNDIARKLDMPMSRLRNALEHLNLPTARKPLPMSRTLSQAQLQELKAIYCDSKGYTTQDLCDHFGISQTALAYAVKLLGLLPRASKPRQLSAQQLSTLAALYREGVSLNALCTRFRINKARIYRELAAMGVERRDEQRKPERILSDDEIDDLQKLYFNTDLPIAVICEDLGIVESALYRHLDRLQAGRRTKESGRAAEMSEKEMERVRDLYRDTDLTVPEICRKTGLTEWTLYRVLALIDEPRRMEESKERRQDTAFMNRVAERYTDTRYSVREICDTFDLPYCSLRQIVEALGLPTRTAHNRKR